MHTLHLHDNYKITDDGLNYLQGIHTLHLNNDHITNKGLNSL